MDKENMVCIDYRYKYKMEYYSAIKIMKSWFCSKLDELEVKWNKPEKDKYCFLLHMWKFKEVVDLNLKWWLLEAEKGRRKGTKTQPDRSNKL